MIRIVLPMPPSANRYWRNYRGVTVSSEEARAYKREVAYLARQAGIQPVHGPLRVTLHFYRPRRAGDLDNRIKVGIDALNGLAWADDAQIVELHCYRRDDKKNPRMEVEVVGLDGCGDGRDSKDGQA